MPGVVLHRATLVRTIPTALITGLVLFAINQLTIVLANPSSVAAWVRSGLCFVVPFFVSNVGVLMGSRIEDTDRAGGRETGSSEPAANPGITS